MLRYTTDRARPGLVALYDIRLGNGAGQFLQPRSPHGADSGAHDQLTCIANTTQRHCTLLGMGITNATLSLLTYHTTHFDESYLHILVHSINMQEHTSRLRLLAYMHG